MPKKPKSVILPAEVIQNKIFLIRGKKVMLDRDLASLYGVTTSNLNKAVNRNLERFPEDFKFRLTREERGLIFQFGTSKTEKRGGVRKPSSVFTEQGIAMLSSVLRSRRAILVNIQIMRTFTKLREMMASHVELRKKIEELENKYDHQFSVVFDAIKKFLEPPLKPKRKIGFVRE